MTTKPFNPFTKIEYSGGNVFKLNQASANPEWATFLQWRGGGFKIKKGEHGVKIAKFIQDTKKNRKTGNIEEVEAVRFYTVFNRTQVVEKEANEI